MRIKPEGESGLISERQKAASLRIAWAQPQGPSAGLLRSIAVFNASLLEHTAHVICRDT